MFTLVARPNVCSRKASGIEARPVNVTDSVNVGDFAVCATESETEESDGAGDIPHQGISLVADRCHVASATFFVFEFAKANWATGLDSRWGLRLLGSASGLSEGEFLAKYAGIAEFDDWSG